jgi:hypothetical protein
MEMLLRKERRPATVGGEPITLRVVAYYRPGDLTTPVCVNPWPSRPDRRHKWVMFNCARYRATWLPDQVQP